MTLIPQEELKNSFVQGAMTASAFWTPDGTSGANILASDLANLAKTIGKGDLSPAEEMLVAQAQSLDAIFNNLAQHAAQRLPNMHLKTTEIILRLALKAQSQCRTTLEALARIKNPPVVFAQQANFANGPQQVNNGTKEY